MPRFSAMRLRPFAMFLALTAWAVPALAANAPQRVLFTYGGWDGHEPESMRDLLVPCLEAEGFEVVVSDTLETYADATVMSDIDLVVRIWTMGEISEPQLGGLVNAVEDGMGIAAWHGGLGDAFRLNGEHDYRVNGAVMPVALKRGILWASRSKYEQTPNLISPRYLAW